MEDASAGVADMDPATADLIARACLDSPKSLQHLTLDFISDNIVEICEDNPKTTEATTGPPPGAKQQQPDDHQQMEEEEVDDVEELEEVDHLAKEQPDQDLEEGEEELEEQQQAEEDEPQQEMQAPPEQGVDEAEEEEMEEEVGQAKLVGLAAKGAAAAAVAPAVKPKLRFPVKDIYFHTHLSEELVRRISEKKTMSDEILNLFTPMESRLVNVQLKNASKLTQAGLRTLKGHKLRELTAIGLTHSTVTELIGCLGDWSTSNLKMLNVSKSTFVDQNKV